MTQVLFIITALSCVVLLYFGTGKNKRLLYIFLPWQVFTGTIAFFNVFEKKPVLFPLAMTGTLILTILMLKQTNKYRLNIPCLLAIHVLRIPVELGLYKLYLQNKIPALMTFTGWNYDILVGVSALILLASMLYIKKSISSLLFITWNIIGLIFLTIIVSLAVLSSPLPIQQFAFEQPNIAVLKFSYSFLPTCIVPAVLMSHILLIGWYSKIKTKSPG